MCVCVCVCVYVYMYYIIYIYRGRAVGQAAPDERGAIAGTPRLTACRVGYDTAHI